MNTSLLKGVIYDHFRSEFLPTLIPLLGERRAGWPDIQRWPSVAKIEDENEREETAINMVRTACRAANKLWTDTYNSSWIRNPSFTLTGRERGASESILIETQKPGSGENRDFPAVRICVEISGPPDVSFPAGDMRRYIIQGEANIECWDKEVYGYDVVHLLADAARASLEHKRLGSSKGDIVFYSADLDPVVRDGENIVLEMMIDFEHSVRR